MFVFKAQRCNLRSSRCSAGYAAFASFYVDSCESFEFKIFHFRTVSEWRTVSDFIKWLFRVRSHFKTASCGFHMKVEGQWVMHVTPNMTCHAAALHSGLSRLLSVLICSFCNGFLHVESSSAIKAVSQGRNFSLVFGERLHLIPQWSAGGSVTADSCRAAKPCPNPESIMNSSWEPKVSKYIKYVTENLGKMCIKWCI